MTANRPAPSFPNGNSQHPHAQAAGNPTPADAPTDTTSAHDKATSPPPAGASPSGTAPSSEAAHKATADYVAEAPSDKPGRTVGNAAADAVSGAGSAASSTSGDAASSLGARGYDTAANGAPGRDATSDAARSVSGSVPSAGATADGRATMASSLERRAMADGAQGAGATTGAALWAKVRARWTGLLLALAVAAVATVLGQFVPVVGGPVFGIVLGVVLATAIPALRADRWKPGLAFASKPILQTSIVVLGTGLSLQQVAQVGSQSLPVMLGTLAVALGGAWVFGRLLKVRGDAQTLIGVGTGICGASAIAATTAVIGAEETQVAYAIGTIFTFNIAAVLLFPALGHLFGMSAHAFGLWSGTAINDTSSVVAAAYSFGGGAGPYSIVVKLTRSLMLIPIVIALAVFRARRTRQAHPAEGVDTVDAPFSVGHGRHALRAGDSHAAASSTTTVVADSRPVVAVASAGVAAAGSPSSGGGHGMAGRSMPWRKIVPPFLIGFVLASALDTIGVIPNAWHPALSTLGTFLITTALAAIGLSLRLADMRRAGPRPLLLGAVLWATVAASSLGLQALTGTIH